MDDFEEAVETQNLPQFLRQDATATDTNTAPTVGEAELERLMREMSDSDLDALAGELGVGDVGKVGLIVPQSEDQPAEDDTSPPSSGDKTILGNESGGDIIIGEKKEDSGVVGGSEIVKNPDLELEKKFAEIEVGGPLPKGEATKDGEGSGLKEIASAGLRTLESKVVGDKDKDEYKAGDVTGKEKLD